MASCGGRLAVVARLIPAMLTFMIVHLTFPTAVLVPATGCYQRFVLLSVHLR
ncbi:hypothetical protein D3C81_1820650 [compost metagenome]